MKFTLVAAVAAAAMVLAAPAYPEGTTRQMYNDTFNSLMGRAIQFNVQPVHSCDGSLCHDRRTLPRVNQITIILTSFSDGGSQICTIKEDNTGYCLNSKGKDMDVSFDGQHWQQGKINQTHFDGE
jgi:hypothetical protein